MDAMDAKEILNHLNHLGYRNITAAQLKEFQKGNLQTTHSIPEAESV